MIEVKELPPTNLELFHCNGSMAKRLLYEQPVTGKTLIARAVSQLDYNFLNVYSSAIDKYIGESAHLIRELFQYARDYQPCIIFMNKTDVIVSISFVKVLHLIGSEDFNGVMLGLEGAVHCQAAPSPDLGPELWAEAAFARGRS